MTPMTPMTPMTSRMPPKRRPPPRVVEVAPRRRGRPPRLSRTAILEKALELIDLEGGEALTMRRLGAELGVEAMSLYRHVANKRALVDGIAERMMLEVEWEAHGGDWADSARCLLLNIRAVALSHPAAFELVGWRALNTEDALRPIEALLTDLRAGGFAPDRAIAIFRLLASYVRGFAMSEIVGFTLASAGKDPSSRLTGEQLPADEFPTIRSLAREISREPTGVHFQAGLETIIAGLRQELARTPPSTGAPSR